MVPQINIPPTLLSTPPSLKHKFINFFILLSLFLFQNMTSSSGRNNNNNNRYPFTASQWQEFEHQALVFKYMASGIPVPPDLLFTIRTSFHSSSSLLNPTKLLFQKTSPHTAIGWNSFQMGFGRKIDPEPGRCRRTDGKKWRCSKEAYPDSKYCERHMHRGRNRSRKPVEVNTTNNTTQQTPNAINPIKTNTYFSNINLLSPHYSSPSFGLSSHQNTNFNFLQPNNREPTKHVSVSGDNESSSSSSSSSSKLTMGSLMSQTKHNNNVGAYTSGFLANNGKKHDCYCAFGLPLNSSERDEHQHQHKKVMHHFLDQWSTKNDDSWPNSEDRRRTQLSISIPNSLHDFFVTQK